jgi:type IV pilus assembly protein PilQ
MKSRKNNQKSRKSSLRAVNLLVALTAALALTSCATTDDEREPRAAHKSSEDLEFGADAAAASPATKQGDLDSASEVTLINDIRYVSRKGGGTVVIESSNPAIFRTRENVEQSQVVIDIANAQLPDRLKRPYVTKDFGQQIAAINAYQDVGSSTARVVIQFKNPTHATVTQAGRRLLILSGTASYTEKDKDGKIHAISATGADVDEISNLAKTASLEGSSGDPRILPDMISGGTEPTRFYGRPISIEVRGSPVSEVINLIAEQSGANVVLGDSIDGKITLKLKQIPWDQALMIVMKSQNLGYVRQGSVLRIAKLTEISMESDAARKVLEAQQAAEPLKVKIIPVSYASVSDLAGKLGPFLSKGGRGQAIADVRTSSIIVTDTAEVIERATSMIRALDTPPLQVLVEGKIIEASDSFKRSFGIKWGNGSSGQDIPVNGNVSLQKNNFNISPNGSTVPGGAFTYNLRLGTLDILGDLDAALGLLESEDKVKIVSSPRIVIMNNEAGTIEQSTTTYTQNSTVANGVTTLSYTPVNVPLSLKVTPQVTADGDVLMTVNINRSFLASQNSAAPANINIRTASTKVMVKNGQTAVIGGVYQSDTVESEQGVPYLRSVPVLGWLFKNRQTSLDKNELLLFLTPRILNAEKTLPKEGNL